MENDNIQQTEEKDRRVMNLVIVALAVIFAILFFSGGLYYLFIDKAEWLIEIFKKQFAAIVLPPLAIGASIVVVSILKLAFGNIKFKVLGMEFEGAAAPIIMFILVFGTIITAIKSLWV